MCTEIGWQYKVIDQELRVSSGGRSRKMAGMVPRGSATKNKIRVHLVALLEVKLLSWQ